MIRPFAFVMRIVIAWSLALLALLIVVANITDGSAGWVVLFGFATLFLAVLSALSHLRRVRLIAGRLDETTVSNRQRRQIEVPLDSGEAFDLVEASIRELPGVEDVQSTRDSLQIRAKVNRPHVYGRSKLWRLNPVLWVGGTRNQITATITPGDGSGSVTLICEPEANAWTDLFRGDDATNLENAEAITRAIGRRVAERRRGEQRAAVQTATEKELSEAKLNLLQAQIEPHFLYNTLASAQVLTRTEPAQADRMLGHLIHYLRHALPRADQGLSSLGEELERTRAYLEIMAIRMGNRLKVKIEVPDELRDLQLPPMMLQTLAENAIKHGLEPKPGGGTVWVLARRDDGHVAITVADDGQGFGPSSGGTGIGLKNIRQRLRLVYGEQASLSVVANVPEGVAATLTVPATLVREDADSMETDA